LQPAEVRLLILGLWRADGSWSGQAKQLYTCSDLFRDQLMQLLLHCGFSPSTRLMYAAGDIRGYRMANVYSVKFVQQLDDDDDVLDSLIPIIATKDCWAVTWCEPTSAGGRDRCFPTFRRQADITMESYCKQRDGRIWCVKVDHADHLIVAQRAERHDGRVTKQSRPIVTGNCLISAYSMSVLYLDGVKMADTQMTFAGLSIAMFFLFISRSKPMDRLSAERPQSRLFTGHMMFSIVGQFALHMLTLLTAVQLSLPHTPTDAETKSPDSAFAPNVLNTVVYLVSTTATTATFIANYRGHPFMQSLTANTWLCRALIANVVAVLVMASGLVPEVNDVMKLAEMPSGTMRLQLMTLIVFDLLSTVLYANLLKRVFAIKPKKSRELMEGDHSANGIVSRLKIE